MICISTKSRPFIASKNIFFFSVWRTVSTVPFLSPVSLSPIANQILSKSQRIDPGRSLVSFLIDFLFRLKGGGGLHKKNVDTQSNQKLSEMKMLSGGLFQAEQTSLYIRIHLN